MTPRKKIYIFITVLAALNFLLLALVFYPLFKGIKENSQELELLKNKIISLQAEEEQLQKVEDLYKTYQLDLEKIAGLFIDPDVPLELISFLESAAVNSGLQMEITAVTKRAEREDPWPNLAAQLSLTGSFAKFLEFLEKLENSPYLIEVSDLNAKSLLENADITAVLSVKVFTR